MTRILTFALRHGNTVNQRVSVRLAAPERLRGPTVRVRRLSLKLVLRRHDADATAAVAATTASR